MAVLRDEVVVEHRIQRHIIGVLIHMKHARFRDLRPPKTDTNLFSYHLKALLKSELVSKEAEGYTLSDRGLGYVDRFSLKKLNLRSQPKIITMLVLTDRNGCVLLQRREKQPYIDTWTLPYGKTHISDRSIAEAASRELHEKLGVADDGLQHAGDAYIRVSAHGEHLSTTLAHVFRGSISRDEEDTVRWSTVEDRRNLRLAPAVEKIIAATASSDHFFLELDEDWR